MAVGCLPFIWMVGTKSCPSYGWWAPHLALLMDGGPAPHLGLLGGGGQLQLIKHLFEFKFVRQFSLGRIWEWAVLPSWGSGWSCCALLTPSVPV